jgi:hypothetical protein
MPRPGVSLFILPGISPGSVALTAFMGGEQKKNLLAPTRGHYPEAKSKNRGKPSATRNSE